MEPTTFIPYELMELLASKSQAKVYRAKRMDGREPAEIAVKKYLLAAKKDRQNIIELLTRQAQTLLRLDHKNVVRHLNTQLCTSTTLTEPDTYDVIMEYCTKGTLQDAVKQDSMSCVLLQKWLREIVTGLVYIHEMGIVHRDLKCENILLTHSDFDGVVAKIGDFGFIKQLLGQHTQNREVSHTKGTVPFMSPEMIQAYSKNVNIGRKTDIWSLGCVVIEMITGAIPKFYNKTRIALDNKDTIMYYIGNGGLPDIPDKLPEELDAFIKDCLTVDPADRPEAAALLNHPFLTMDVSTIVLPMIA